MTITERRKIIDFLSPELLKLHCVQEASWIADFIESSESTLPDERFRMVKVQEILSRRQKHEPLAYIFGNWAFRNYEFFVGPGVLIPRPETEELVEGIIKTVENSEMTASVLLNPICLEEFVIADLGAGTGAIGLSMVADLLRDLALDGLNVEQISKKMRLILVESSSEARVYLEKNIVHMKKFLFNTHCEVVTSTWQEWAQINESPLVDILVSNPPYVTASEFELVDASVKNYEPYAALVPTDIEKFPDASGPYRDLLELAEVRVKDNGWLWCEMGQAQVSWIQPYAAAMGCFNDLRTLKDMAKKPRFFGAKRNSR